MAYHTDKNGNYKRTVTCSHCYDIGHNRGSCPDLKKQLVNRIAEYEKQLAEDKFSDDWERNYAQTRLNESKAQQTRSLNKGKNRKCSYCNERAGHTRRTCEYRKTDINSEAYKIKRARELLGPRMDEAGLGPGALLECDGEIYTVESVSWQNVTQKSVLTGHRNYLQPIVARSFPTRDYTLGRRQYFNLPNDVANVNNCEIDPYQKDKYVLVSSAPTASLPSDFASLSGCVKVAEKMEMFNDGSRPYEYQYPEG